MDKKTTKSPNREKQDIPKRKVERKSRKKRKVQWIFQNF